MAPELVKLIWNQCLYSAIKCLIFNNILVKSCLIYDCKNFKVFELIDMPLYLFNFIHNTLFSLLILFEEFASQLQNIYWSVCLNRRLKKKKLYKRIEREKNFSTKGKVLIGNKKKKNVGWKKANIPAGHSFYISD